jgi:hypothetical protein
LNEYLGTTSFDEGKFKKKVEYMVALKNNKIELHLTNGSVDVVTWEELSRKDSWTPEMKEKARQNTKKINKNRSVLTWEKLESYHQPSIH